MSRLYLHTYSVSGATQFPVDMLRYDQSFPATEPTAYLIRGSVLNGGEHSRLTVQLRAVGPKDWRPTAGRWESFGWRIVGYDKAVAL